MAATDLSENERANIARLFNHVRDTFLERGLIPVAILGLERSDAGLYVISLVDNKADIRAMLTEYVDKMGTHDTTEELFVIPTGPPPTEEAPGS